MKTARNLVIYVILEKLVLVVSVALHTLLVITIAMMKTIIQDVNMMVEIAVVIMSTHTTALLVNVWNNNLNL